jgi:transposase
VDTNGLPVHLALTPGEAHDNRLCSVLLSALLPRRILLADRGYDVDWMRKLARQQGAWATIPPKRNRKGPICFSLYLYRARNLIERFFNKIKQCRRIATRNDKLAANYLAFIKPAFGYALTRPPSSILACEGGSHLAQVADNHGRTALCAGLTMMKFKCRPGISGSRKARPALIARCSAAPEAERTYPVR